MNDVEITIAEIVNCESKTAGDFRSLCKFSKEEILLTVKGVIDHYKQEKLTEHAAFLKTYNNLLYIEKFNSTISRKLMLELQGIANDAYDHEICDAIDFSLEM